MATDTAAPTHPDRFLLPDRISNKPDELSMAAVDPLNILDECLEDGTLDCVSDINETLPTQHARMHIDHAGTQQAEEINTAIRVDGVGEGHSHSYEYDIAITRTRRGNAIDLNTASIGEGDDVILETQAEPMPPHHYHQEQQHPPSSPDEFLDLSDPMDPLQLFADELARDAMLERQQIEDDIHGTRLLVEETEEFLCAKLDDMESEISKIASKRGYEMALELNPEYAGGRPMREMFLRSAAYDSHLAAHKLVRWYDAILEHFGVEAVARPLRLIDLTPEAYHILMIGKFQLLPTPDAAGRSVMVFFKNTVDTYSTYAIMQVLLYITCSIYGCDDLQRQGVITVHKFDVVPGTPKERVDPDMYHCGHVTHLMPVRLEAFHFVGNQEYQIVQTAVNKFQRSIADDIRNRFRVHLGDNYRTNMELLSTFGVPIRDLPFVDNAGDILISNHMHWVTKRKILEGCGILAPNSIMRHNNCNLYQLLLRTRTTNAITNKRHTAASETDSCTTVSDEASASSSNTAISTSHASGEDKTDEIIPTDDDVLMGQRRPFLKHPGNRFLRSKVADKSKEYDKASRAKKYDMAKDVVRAIYGKQGRFLKMDATTGLWVEVTWCVAREKVAHAFRKRRELDLAKARKAKAKQQQEEQQKWS